jgi:hypothetical protein
MISLESVPACPLSYNVRVLDDSGTEVWADGTYSLKEFAIDNAQNWVNKLMSSQKKKNDGADVRWRCARRGQVVPVVGFEVVCAKCTGGCRVLVPADEFDMAVLQQRISERMTWTSQGWVCKRCASGQ